MKPTLEHIRERTLDELEGVSSVAGDSYLLSEMRRLRRVPLREFRLEDLRLLIGQSIGLSYLVPMALSHLQEHPLASGHFYPGDLLKQLMAVDEAFWAGHADLRAILVVALERALPRVRKVKAPPELEGAIKASLERHRSAPSHAV